MNLIAVMGRLTRDPEVRYSQTGTAVANMSIAVDRRFKRDGDPDADFFRLVAFGKTAEFAEKHLGKGTKIVVTGRLQNSSYTDREGKTVTQAEIIADNIEFAESKAKGTQPETTDFVQVPDGIQEELPFN